MDNRFLFANRTNTLGESLFIFRHPQPHLHRYIVKYKKTWIPHSSDHSTFDGFVRSSDRLPAYVTNTIVPLLQRFIPVIFPGNPVIMAGGQCAGLVGVWIAWVMSRPSGWQRLQLVRTHLSISLSLSTVGPLTQSQVTANFLNNNNYLTLVNIRINK